MAAPLMCKTHASVPFPFSAWRVFTNNSDLSEKEAFSLMSGLSKSFKRAADSLAGEIENMHHGRNRYHTRVHREECQ